MIEFVHELLQTLYANYTLDIEPIGTSVAGMRAEKPGLGVHVNWLIHNVDLHVIWSTPGSRSASTFQVRAEPKPFGASPAAATRLESSEDGTALSRALRFVLMMTQEATRIRIILHDSGSSYWPTIYASCQPRLETDPCCILIFLQVYRLE